MRRTHSTEEAFWSLGSPAFWCSSLFEAAVESAELRRSVRYSQSVLARSIDVTCHLIDGL